MISTEQAKPASRDRKDGRGKGTERQHRVGRVGEVNLAKGRRSEQEDGGRAEKEGRGNNKPSVGKGKEDFLFQG